MIQVGATVSYHDQMDEQPEQSWSASIRSAVQEFVEAISESSKELAGATERFARESLQAVEAARAKSEQSAEESREMANQARQAAEEARSATEGLQAAVEEAREALRNETRTSVEQVASQTAQIHEIGAQVKYDLQQRIDEMTARFEAGTSGHKEALEVAQAATTAARAAADRIEISVNAVEAAVAAARDAAEEARRAAEQTAEKAGNVSMAVVSAQEAAESSRQAASLAEQAGKRSDFATEAGMLLERLETDYSLLTRLVQELHSRISSLSAVSVAAAAPVYAPADEEAPQHTDADAPEAEELQSYETAGEAFTVAAQDEQTDESASGPAWPSEVPADLDVPAAEPLAAIASEWQAEAGQGTPSLPAMTFESPAPAAPSIMLSGRVQMTISPVPDFDRLLSLDSALARVDNVSSVTLADYAHEEVIFRVELGNPVSVDDFKRQLSDTAGVSTEVLDASEGAVRIRIG